MDQMPWSIPVELPTGDQPLFLRIAGAIVHDIRRGRLVAGERLPSSRMLARELDVHRNTALAALAELTAQGWIESQPARGVFVAKALPAAPRRSALPRRETAGFTVPAGLRGALESGGERTRALRGPRGMLRMDRATPDPRMVPVELLARAWRRNLLRKGRQLLSYDAPHGHLGLRCALAEMLRQTRGMACTEQEVLTTRGSQMAIDLVARTLLEPGDGVAVEALGYRPAWDALAWAGAELFPVPVDRHGLDVDALARLAERRRLRAVYLTPHHHYPTTVTLSPARRMQLMSLAQRHRWILLEDDYDSELHFEGRPVAPLASADPQRNVIYVGTLSKILAPGLRLGFVVAPPDVVPLLAKGRFLMDRQGDLPMEAAVAELIEEGELQRHVRKLRNECLARRDTLVAELRAQLGSVVTFEPPRGGMVLWAEVDPEIDATAWCETAEQEGLMLARPEQWAFEPPLPNALRLAYSELRKPELKRAVEILAKMWKHARRGRGRRGGREDKAGAT
jgi:GntR family transcriptional regulator/MocR family aminotransferase